MGVGGNRQVWDQWIKAVMRVKRWELSVSLRETPKPDLKGEVNKGKLHGLLNCILKDK